MASHTVYPPRNERDQRAYEHCRDVLFPLLKRLKAKARKIIVEKQKAEQEAKP